MFGVQSITVIRTCNIQTSRHSKLIEQPDIKQDRFGFSCSASIRDHCLMSAVKSYQTNDSANLVSPMSTIQTCVAIVVLQCTDTLWIHDTRVQKCGLMTGSYDRSNRRTALTHCVLLVEIRVTNTFKHLTLQEFLGAVDDWEQMSMALDN